MLRNKNGGLRVPKMLAGLVLGASMMSAQASVLLFTDEAAWLSAVTDIETFNTTAANVALANEIASAPARNTALTNPLTFDATNTGLSRGFTVEALQNGANFTFDDDENAGNLTGFDAALSVGDINNHDDDDWILTLTSGPAMSAFAFELGDSHDASGESLLVGTTTVDISGVPTNPGGFQFIGVVASFNFTSVSMNEDSGGDDIAIANLRFATAAVPEPLTASLFALGLLGAGAVSRRQVRS